MLGRRSNARLGLERTLENSENKNEKEEPLHYNNIKGKAVQREPVDPLHLQAQWTTS
jgi:hypothetical protein